MKIATPPASWIPDTGNRLHAGPYASRSVHLRRRLRELNGVPLSSLTTGPYGGIYTPPIHNFKRVYVTSEEHGVPFLGTTSMLHADFVGVPLLSREQAESEKLRILRINAGMTLISCSGTIGRTVYARPDMEGMWSSGDTLKVVPNESKVHSGYLHAVLSSRAGVAAMVAETYGSIIPHIEAGHIAQLPIPRLGDKKERRIGSLISAAAAARSKARGALSIAEGLIRQHILPTNTMHSTRNPSLGVPASMLQERLDAYYYSHPCLSARATFDRANTSRMERLGDVAEVFIPGIFKRRFAGLPEHGYPYLTGADVFQIAPAADRFLMREVAEQNRLLVEPGMILIQEAGQLGGLIGHSVMVGEHYAPSAVTNNMIRVRCEDASDAGYLYAILRTREGVTLISRESAGSSIPHIDADRVRRLMLPWPQPRVRKLIAEPVLEALRLREQACAWESEARTAVDAVIEEAA